MDSGDDRYSTAGVGRDWALIPGPASALIDSYVYYHCSRFKAKCPEPYVREEVIAERFMELLGRLRFSDEVLAWVSAALRESYADEKQEHEAAVARLQTEYERLQNRIHAMYVDKLDGRIDKHFFEKLSADWRKEQDRCLREIGWHQTADQSYLEEGVRLLDLAHSAQRLFANRSRMSSGVC